MLLDLSRRHLKMDTTSSVITAITSKDFSLRCTYRRPAPRAERKQLGVTSFTIAFPNPISSLPEARAAFKLLVEGLPADLNREAPIKDSSDKKNAGKGAADDVPTTLFSNDLTDAVPGEPASDHTAHTCGRNLYTNSIMLGKEYDS